MWTTGRRNLARSTYLLQLIVSCMSWKNPPPTPSCMLENPCSITTDNGPQIVSAEYAEYMSAEGVRHRRVTPKHALEKRMQIAHAEGSRWKTALMKKIKAYHVTSHSTTGQTPSKLLMNYTIKTRCLNGMRTTMKQTER